MILIGCAKQMDFLKEISSSVHDAFPNSEFHAFSDETECIQYASEFICDIAILDAKTCPSLGKELYKTNPSINLFLTSDNNQDKITAMDLHACSFVERPVQASKLREEMKYLRSPVEEDPNIVLRAQCFGNFEVFDMDGKPVHFSRSKSKELFAYLVYRRGASCTSREIGAVLFEDQEYDDKQQFYVRQLVSTLIRTMREIGADEAVVHSYNNLSVNPNVIDCDYFRFMEKDETVLDKYTGEFMSQYPWAEDVAGYLDRALDGE